MAARHHPVLKAALLALLLCASAMILAMVSSGPSTSSSFLAEAASTSKRAKRAKAEAAAAAAPSAADTILSALNVKTLLANEPNARLAELGDLSDSDETRTRMYLSPAHQKAAALIKKWMVGAGLEVTTDAVEATVAEAAVAKGLITNRQLSKALASGKRVADLVPRKEIEGALLSKGVEVIAFADQEGARFGVPMASSKAVVGTYESEGLLERADARGKTIAQALKEADPKGSFASFADSVIKADEVEGYVEAHIEQYDKLERIGSPVGIVTAVAGTTVMHVSVKSGDEKSKVLAMSHAASVPMAARGDPVPAVAEAVLALEKRCKEDAKGAPHGVLCGVHFLTLDPNSPLNIPSGANFTVTVASTSDSSRRLVVDNIVKDLDEICKKRKLACQVSG